MNGESLQSASPNAFDDASNASLNNSGAEKRSLREAFFWMPVLSALFIGVYGSCMWITAGRSDVGTSFFTIERWIPFVPAMIIPYWSLDLFFAGSTFVCTTKGELHTLVKRIFFVILTAGLCFLLFPLQLGFKRPEVTGFFGFFFHALRSFDLPYNLAPSLHIALRSILWPVYTRHTRGALNVAVKIWFVLIGLSTLLVWQHHLIDVLSGQMLAMLCLYLIPRWETSAEQRAQPVICPPRKFKIAIWYLLGAAALAAVANMILPWGLLLVWPAFGLGMMATAYLKVGAAAFRKYEGRIPIAAQLVLAPYLLGNRVCFLYYTRGCPAFCEIAPGVIMGRRLSCRESEELVAQGVSSVLDLTAEYSENKVLRSLTYRNIQILDLTLPTVWQLTQAVDFIGRHAASGKVYIHCALGYSRSAGVAAAWLMKSGRAANAKEALEMVQRVRPGVVIHEGLLEVLEAYRRETSS